VCVWLFVVVRVLWGGGGGGGGAGAVLEVE
jgi:hypothetical protein